MRRLTVGPYAGKLFVSLREFYEVGCEHFKDVLHAQLIWGTLGGTLGLVMGFPVTERSISN